MASESEKFRQAGNKILATATANLAPTIREGRLQKTLNQYFRAYQEAATPADKSSAAKNYGIAAWRMSGVQQELGNSARAVTSQYEETLKYFDHALQAAGAVGGVGRETRAEAWIADITDKCVSAAGELAAYRQGQTGEDYDLALLQVARSLGDAAPRLRLCLAAADSLHKAAVCACELRDFRSGLKHVRECHFPLEDAARLSRMLQQDLSLNEVQELERNVLVTACALESIQMRRKGDALLKDATEGYEHVALDLVWDAIDAFHQAALLTRGTEVELDAIALSRIGQVYYKVLKLEDRAKQFYTQAVQLVLALEPRNFDSEAWFVQAKQALAVLQQKQAEKLDKEELKERQEVLDELKPELFDLKQKQEKDATVLLEYIYKTHPPRRPNSEIHPEYKTDKRKGLRRALTHYHPDKQVEADGQKWRVLCDEITKVLNNKYEYFKFVE